MAFQLKAPVLTENREVKPSPYDPIEASSMQESKAIHLQHPASLPPEKPKVAPATREWGKVRKLALRQLNRFASLEPKVLKGDNPDAIHDMRVASRRLQQVLDLVYSKPLPREVRRLRCKIRRCRRSLGDVRNCDVLLQRVGSRLARKRCSGRQAWKAVKQYLEERRSESFSRAIRKLGKVNLAIFYMRAKATLDQLIPAPNQGEDSPPGVQPGGALEPFSAQIAHTLAGVWSEFENQVAVSHREATPAALHGARICAKRLRYLLEVVDEFGVSGSSDVLAWLRRIQQHLGDWHDIEILEEAIIKMIARPEFLRDHLPLAMAAAKLIVRNRATKQKFKEKYFQMTLDSPDYQRVKEWIERLLAAPPAVFSGS
jgi:CHAD domain-containing protein